MKFISGLISASIILGELLLHIRPSECSRFMTSFSYLVLVLSNYVVILQDCSGHFPETASQQLLNRGHYGTAFVRAMQNVRYFPFPFHI